MNTSRARVFLGAGSAVLVLLCGCTVSEPGATEWRDDAVQTLDDVASEVATARLTLEQLDAGRLPSSYGVTVMADAETALSTSEESLSSLQPPPGLGARADRVLALVGRAADAVQQARESVVAGKFHLPGLLTQLTRLQRALDQRKASL
jgi:hypothetical protein